MKYITGLILLFFTLTTLAHQPSRVVSLGGDITGIVYSLGAGDSLVGVDSTSTWPAQAQQLPNVGYVRQLSSEGILALRPDMVLATHDAGPPAVLEQLRQLAIPLQQLPVDYSAQGIINKVAIISEALHQAKTGKALITKLSEQAQTLQQAVDSMAYHPRVVSVLSVNSGLIVAGKNTAADAAIHLAGGRNVVAAYNGYKPLSNEALIELQPDVLLVMRTGADGSSALSSHGAVMLTPAGKKQQIFTVDGEKLLGFGIETLSQALELQQRLATIKP